jgi:hypothetical protein
VDSGAGVMEEEAEIGRVDLIFFDVLNRIRFVFSIFFSCFYEKV